MHKSLCVCALVAKAPNATRVILVIHHSELRKSTNTGRLAIDGLANAEIVVRGRRGEPDDPLVLAESERPVLLYPADDATPLDALPFRPTTLIVPDGNWRQAFKVRARVPALRDLPCAILPPGPPSIYRLRAEAHEHGLATLEAITRALAILEGPELVRPLEHAFRAMVERTLWSRGALDDHEVTGGVPAGATRHDPESGVVG
jgi:DTW domain-containing protein YfiP